MPSKNPEVECLHCGKLTRKISEVCQDCTQRIKEENSRDAALGRYARLVYDSDRF